MRASLALDRHLSARAPRLRGADIIPAPLARSRRYGDSAAYARNDSLVCYVLNTNGALPPALAASAAADDFGDYEGTVVDSDPEDPIFYSTCYRVGTSWKFSKKNAPCPACESASTRWERACRMAVRDLDCEIFRSL